MKRVRRLSALFWLAALLALATLGCGSSDGPPSDAVIVDVLANTSLTPWLNEAISQFNESEAVTSEDNPIFVQLVPTDAGQAIVDITAGSEPDLWIPDNAAWAGVLADQGNDAFTGDCVSVAESPLVIAMWQAVAESLGWPGRELGWLDIGSLAADPSAWAYYSGGQYGDLLRLGHTHPGLSATGASTLLAIVQAAQLQEDAVTAADIDQPIVQASVGAFESAVSWFSSSTGDLAETMRSRGIGFLGAGVMYESDVFNQGAGADAETTLVPIYPFEGTFMATHPACINAGADAESVEAAEMFRNFLLTEEAQQLAMAKGLRPASGDVPADAPLASHPGVDLDQPQIEFQPPSVSTVYAVQELWQEARKDVNLVMAIDVSGSMRGEKMENVRRAARQFVEQMGDDDYLSIVAFSTEPMVLVSHERVGDSRQALLLMVDRLSAGGDTALYDAIGDSAVLIDETTSPENSNALVVLSDGQDTFSQRYLFNQSLIDLAAGNGTTVFTIAYGDDANAELLEMLAFQANGNFFLGDEANIDAIYEELSAAFGGSAGVGR